MSNYGFQSLGIQQSHQKKWKKSVFEVYKDASVPFHWTQHLKDHCYQIGIDYFSAPYNLDAVDSLEDHIPAYKIGSGDITWLDIIEKIAQKGKPVLLATGAATMKDVQRAVDIVLKHNHRLVLMQCNTNYTASLENFKYINLNVLATYQQSFPGLVYGLSDHTPGHATVLGAITLGARVIEKHFTDDNNRKGPDHPFSMNPETWKDMVDRSRELERALGDGVKRIEGNETETVVLQQRAIRVSQDLVKGDRISLDNIEILRPCPKDACKPYESANLLGKPLSTSVKKGDYLRPESVG